jgi:hypothetical protein
MTIVEAMRCGLPVVSTDCPHGPGEIIRDGVDGRLVPTGDANAVAEALLGLIKNDGLRSTMGHAALRNSARFDPAGIAARHEALFTELIAQGSHGPITQPGARRRTPERDRTTDRWVPELGRDATPSEPNTSRVAPAVSYDEHS